MKTLALILILTICSGCSAFQPDKQTLNLNCEYTDTVVLVNGTKQPCPSKIDVARDLPLTIEASKPGYYPYHRYIGKHLSSYGKWDIAGTIVWFFPIFGTWTPGAWDLDETDIMVSLMPAK